MTTKIYKSEGAFYTALDVSFLGQGNELEHEGFEREESGEEGIVKYSYRGGLATIIAQDLGFAKVAITIQDNNINEIDEIKSKLEELTGFKLSRLVD